MPSLKAVSYTHLDVYKRQVCGLFRRDLAELLKELQPGFLRFPGGCIVEGNTLDNRYRWKESVGPMEERRVNWSRWSVHAVSYTHLTPPICTLSIREN